MKNLNNRPNILLFFTTALLALVMSAGSLWADDYHYVNDLIGDRATGFGGAYTALSDDPSGAYYNPAGLAFALSNQISLSVNSYKIENRVYNKTINNQPYERNLEAFYPSFFGVVQTLGNFKMAITFMNVNRELLDQDDEFNNINGDPINSVDYVADDFIINYNLNDNTVLAGFSLATILGRSFSLGMSIHGLKRRTEQIANQTITFGNSTSSATPYTIQNQYFTNNRWGYWGRLGAQYMPTKSFIIGASAAWGQILSHKAYSQVFIKDYRDGGEFAETTFFKTNTEEDGDKLPLNARAGLAWIPNQRLALSADVIADIGDRNYLVNTNQVTLNYALGVEYYLTNAIPVRAGVFTNFANTPEIVEGQINQSDHINLYGVSLALSWETRNSAITLSGYSQSGSGQAQIVEGTPIQETDIHMMSFSLTGTAKY